MHEFFFPRPKARPHLEGVARQVDSIDGLGDDVGPVPQTLLPEVVGQVQAKDGLRKPGGNRAGVMQGNKIGGNKSRTGCSASKPLQNSPYR